MYIKNRIGISVRKLFFYFYFLVLNDKCRYFSHFSYRPWAGLGGVCICSFKVGLRMLSCFYLCELYTIPFWGSFYTGFKTLIGM